MIRRAWRYLELWNSLPPDERRIRKDKVLDRWRPSRLSIAAFRQHVGLGEKEIAKALRRQDPRRSALHGELDARLELVLQRCPEHAEALLQSAEALLARRFDLLGSGPVAPMRDEGHLDWRLDPVSGHRFSGGAAFRQRHVRGDGSDIKWPWELARCQHFITFGQAHLLAPRLRAGQEGKNFALRCAAEVRAQLEDFIAENPPGRGVHWACSMEVGLRALSWIAALGLLRGAEPLDDACLYRVAHALWLHGRHIRANLEIGEGGLTSNHYLANVLGLYAVACFLPESPEAASWRGFAREALIHESAQQLLADGADFERSIPYHRLVTEMFLHAALLMERSGDGVHGPLWDRLGGALAFTRAYTRGDGSASQWGDGDDGRALPLDGYGSQAPHDHRHILALGGALVGRADIAAAGRGREAESLWLLDAPPEAPERPRVPRPLTLFPDVGYAVLRDEGLHAGMAFGPVGTRGEGNHTHNDLLALALWCDGRELVVDPGTGTYSRDPELRNRLRATAAHATLQVGALEQQRLGDGLDGLFRVFDEGASPRLVAAEDDRVEAVHHGYREPGGAWEHRRRLQLVEIGRALVAEDTLTWNGGGEPREKQATLRWPLGTGLRVARLGRDDAPEGRCLFTLEIVGDGWPGATLELELPPGARLELDEGLLSPRYGVTEPALVVVVEMPLSVKTVATTRFVRGAEEGSR